MNWLMEIKMNTSVTLRPKLTKALELLAVIEDKTVEQYIHDKLIDGIEESAADLPIQILNILEMGRTKPLARKKFESLQDQIAYHLFKLYSFPESGAVRGWLKELNTWKRDLTRFNIDKERANRKNFNRSRVSDFIWDDPFGNPLDIKLHIDHTDEDGFPKIIQSSVDIEKLKKMVDTYIDRIMDGKVFKV